MTIVRKILPDTYAERVMQLRDARYAVDDGLWRLRLALLELQACLARAQPDVCDERISHYHEQRNRTAVMVGHVDDLRDYMNQEEAWI